MALLDLTSCAGPNAGIRALRLKVVTFGLSHKILTFCWIFSAASLRFIEEAFCSVVIPVKAFINICYTLWGLFTKGCFLA